MRVRATGAVPPGRASSRAATGPPGAVPRGQPGSRAATAPPGAVPRGQPGSRAATGPPGAVPRGQPGSRTGRLTRSAVRRRGVAGGRKVRRQDRRPGPEVPGHNQVIQAQPPARANRGPRRVSRAQPGRRGATWDARPHATILDAPRDGPARGRPRLTRARSPRRAATWAGPGFPGVRHRQMISVVVRWAATWGGPVGRGRLRQRTRRAGALVRMYQRRRLPPSRPGRWVACVAAGTGPPQNLARTVPPHSGPRGNGRPSPPAHGAARPKPAPRRSRPAAAHGSATRRPWRWRRPRAPRHGRPGAASTPTSPAPVRRSRWTIRPATGRAPARSRPWIPARAGPPRSGPGPSRKLMAGAGNGVPPVRPRRPRRLTGRPAPPAGTPDGPRKGRPGRPGPPARAAGRDAAGPAG